MPGCVLTAGRSPESHRAGGVRPAAAADARQEVVITGIMAATIPAPHASRWGRTPRLSAADRGSRLDAEECE